MIKCRINLLVHQFRGTLIVETADAFVVAYLFPFFSGVVYRPGVAFPKLVGRKGITEIFKGLRFCKTVSTDVLS